MACPRSTTALSAVQEQEDWVAAVLAGERYSGPDNPFLYDMPVLQLLTAVLTRASGAPLDRLVERHLPELNLVYWRADPGGLALGGNDAYLEPHDLLMLGELCRNGGRLRGRQALSTDYIQAATSLQSQPKVRFINRGTLATRGYGFLWWLITAGNVPGCILTS